MKRMPNLHEDAPLILRARRDAGFFMSVPGPIAVTRAG